MGMKIVLDDLWLCADCLMVACNGDTSGIESDARVQEVVSGLAKLGPNLVSDFDSETGDGIEEFARKCCDGCNPHKRLGGSYHRFAILGPADPEPSPLPGA